MVEWALTLTWHEDVQRKVKISVAKEKEKLTCLNRGLLTCKDHVSTWNESQFGAFTGHLGHCLPYVNIIFVDSIIESWIINIFNWKVLNFKNKVLLRQKTSAIAQLY